MYQVKNKIIFHPSITSGQALKIAIQASKMYPLFRVLSITTTASKNKPLVTKRKSRIKLKRCSKC